MRRALVLLLIVCAACIRVSAQDASPIWSAPVTLAQTAQADAPALAISSGQTVVAWIGADERGVHQDVRRLLGGVWSDPITLPLPPNHPYAQQLIAGSGGSTHLLWLDADSDGKTHLFSAFLAPDLTVERGPVSVSDGQALSYTAVPDGAGGAWVAWSGGLISEPSVSMRRIDDAGRPLLEAARIASSATDPALVRASDGGVWLFWIAGGQLMRQRLNVSGEAQALTGAVSLAPGDRLIDVRAALDATSAYFFWNITRKDGTEETWLTSGALDARFWTQPERLRLTFAAAWVESGLTLGKVSAATPGGAMSLRWIEPAAGQFDLVAAAVETDAGLGIVLLRGGQVVGYTTVVPGVRLIGSPALLIDANGGLDLAWSAPGDTSANLQIISTHNP